MDRQALRHVRAMQFESTDRRRARRLAAVIESELAAMVPLVAESANAPRSGDIYARRARGSILHDFYGGAERIFEHIAADLYGSVPDAANWDQQLLTDMARPIPELRPAVIDDDLRDRLAEYRGFRLLSFTNTVHDDVRLRHLEERLPRTMDDFQAQVRAFTAWLLGT